MGNTPSPTPSPPDQRSMWLVKELKTSASNSRTNVCLCSDMLELEEVSSMAEGVVSPYSLQRNDWHTVSVLQERGNDVCLYHYIVCDTKRSPDPGEFISALIASLSPMCRKRGPDDGETIPGPPSKLQRVSQVFSLSERAGVFTIEDCHALASMVTFDRPKMGHSVDADNSGLVKLDVWIQGLAQSTNDWTWLQLAQGIVTVSPGQSSPVKLRTLVCVGAGFPHTLHPAKENAFRSQETPPLTLWKRANRPRVESRDTYTILRGLVQPEGALVLYRIAVKSEVLFDPEAVIPSGRFAVEDVLHYYDEETYDMDTGGGKHVAMVGIGQGTPNQPDIFTQTWIRWLTTVDHLVYDCPVAPGTAIPVAQGLIRALKSTDVQKLPTTLRLLWCGFEKPGGWIFDDFMRAFLAVQERCGKKTRLSLGIVDVDPHDRGPQPWPGHLVVHALELFVRDMTDETGLSEPRNMRSKLNGIIGNMYYQQEAPVLVDTLTIRFRLFTPRNVAMRMSEIVASAKKRMLKFLDDFRVEYNLSGVRNVILIDETAGSGLESWEALVGRYGSPSDGPFPGSKVRYRRWVDEPVGEPASRPTWCTEATTKLRSQEAPPQPGGDQGMDYWTDDAFLLRPRMPSLDVEYGPAFE